MNNRLILGPLLGAILGRRLGAGAAPGGVGGGLGGALGGALGGGALGRGLGGRGAIIAMLLPYAMQWVQRNGGVGAVLERFREKGYNRQVSSWVGTGDNEVIDERAVDDVVGREELSKLSQQLGVSEAELKQDLAATLPEIVNQLTPTGVVHPDADRMLDESIPHIEQEVQQARLESQHN